MTKHGSRTACNASGTLAGMENVTVRFDPDTINTLDAIAKKEDRSRSSTVRVLVNEAITARSTRGSDIDAAFRQVADTATRAAADESGRR